MGIRFVNRIAKETLRKLVRACGLELVRYTPQQHSCLRYNPSLHYRDFVAQQAIALPTGEISLTEARFLGDLVRNLETDGPVIEVGTLFGWSTRVMALYKGKDRELITIDNYSWNPLGLSSDVHFKISEQVLMEAIREFNVRQMRIDKNDFYLSYTGMSPALVFFDAVHTYPEVRADIDWALKVGAVVICGHDYDRHECPGVVDAVDESGGPKELVGTLWVL
jgi:hypothetical protein